MTSGSHTDSTRQSGLQTTVDSQPRPPVRLRLKPNAPPTGYVDGAWWPRSRELADELTALADVLATRLGPVIRVAFDPTAWNPVGEVHGRAIRLAPLRSQEKHIARVSGSDGGQLTLLVVPPEAAGSSGHDAIMLAARHANTDEPAGILAAAGVIPAATQQNKHSTLRPRLRTRRPQR